MDAEDLYLLVPEDFTAARDAAAAQAKADGDRAAARDLKALRRPSVAAWLVNRLASSETELLDSLLVLGPELAQAQATGSGDQLRELSAQRRALVEAVTARAVALADRQVPSAVRAEVSGTLEAALSDPGSAQAVRSGRLVRALSYAGFGDVDLAGAVAGAAGTRTPAARSRRDGAADDRTQGGTGPAGRSAERAPATGRARAVAQAEAAALAAAGELDDAVRSCERLVAEAERSTRELAEARERSERARSVAAAASQALRDARADSEQAERAVEEATRVIAEVEQRSARALRSSEQAVERVRAAQLDAERSRAALDELRRPRTR